MAFLTKVNKITSSSLQVLIAQPLCRGYRARPWPGIHGDHREGANINSKKKNEIKIQT